MHSPQGEHGVLTTYGLDATVLATFQDSASIGTELARLVRVDRDRCLVATAAGIRAARLSRSSGSTPVTGDWVVVRRGPAGDVAVEGVLPRRTAVTRINPAGNDEQVLVANIDTIFVLHGIDRPHRVGRLERLSILTWDGGAQPVIVITKTDLAGTSDAVIEIDEAITEVRGALPAVPIHPVSSATGEGLGALSRYLGPAQTVGVAGESGAGKSTLINRLIGRNVQDTGPVRRGDHKGRHTTTSRELLPAPSGGLLVDTPGLRMIAMPGREEGVARAYADVEALFANCRFRNCRHGPEPACAVSAALACGELSAKRWKGYQKLQREIAYEARRAGERQRRDAVRERTRRARAQADLEVGAVEHTPGFVEKDATNRR